MTSLLPIIDAALADAAARSGSWLACGPGCHQCCVGVFPVSAFDAQTLRAALNVAEPALANRILSRATASRTRLTPHFPGDAASGILFTEPEHEDLFEDFANDEPCPVLDPATGTCDLYAARPIQCRTFGPPIRDAEDRLTVCELCFVGAPPSEVARCEMDQSWREQEDAAVAAAERESNRRGLTLIAFALSEAPASSEAACNSPA